MPLNRLLIGFATLLAVGVIIILLAYRWLLQDYRGPGPAKADQIVLVTPGMSLTRAAEELETAGLIDSAARFRVQARLFAGDRPIQLGEYAVPAGASASDILSKLQSGDVIRYTVTIPEGMPSILVQERLMAIDGLIGDIAAPPEGTILPETYSYVRGEERQVLITRMRAAMQAVISDAWPKRAAGLPLKSAAEAVSLAAIVEKETSKPEEYRRVAGVYITRLRLGMPLQADPTVIYPITKGKPLGRRIRRSELDAVNDYNTYTRLGLPKGPITNPGRAAIEAVLNPDITGDIFFVADGSGGHRFAKTLEEHEANVRAWRQFRAENGI